MGTYTLSHLSSLSDAGAGILSKTRKKARSAVNLSMVYAYCKSGKSIVAEKQDSRNFSSSSLKQRWQFCQGYSQNPIRQTLSDELAKQYLANLEVSLQSAQDANFMER